MPDPGVVGDDDMDAAEQDTDLDPVLAGAAARRGRRRPADASWAVTMALDDDGRRRFRPPRVPARRASCGCAAPSDERARAAARSTPAGSGRSRVSESSSLGCGPPSTARCARRTR